MAGRRVLVTRAAGQASQLARELELHGLEPIVVPVIEIAPPESYEGLDNALRALKSFDWLIFTSANAVMVFGERMAVLELPIETPRIAVIGAATARAVEELGLRPEIVPQRAVAEALAEALRSHVAGKQILLVRAETAREVLPQELAEAGGTVRIADAYRNIIPINANRGIAQVFSEGVDAIPFTSSSSVTNLLAVVGKVPEGVVLASIGPVTTATLREHGLEPDVEAEEATVVALARAVATKLSIESEITVSSTDTRSENVAHTATDASAEGALYTSLERGPRNRPPNGSEG